MQANREVESDDESEDEEIPSQQDATDEEIDYMNGE